MPPATEKARQGLGGLCAPAFSLRYLVASHGLDDCSKEDKVAILDAFHVRSQLTWADLKRAHRHAIGSKKIAQGGMKVPLPECVTPDTVLLAFRCIGKAPMIGFREDDRFQILWVDRRFDRPAPLPR